jgi:hypothetical protein
MFIFCCVGMIFCPCWLAMLSILTALMPSSFTLSLAKSEGGIRFAHATLQRHFIRLTEFYFLKSRN